VIVHKVDIDSISLSTDGYQMPPIAAEPDCVVPLRGDERSVVQYMIWAVVESKIKKFSALF